MLLGAPAPLAADTDEPPSHDLLLRDESGAVQRPLGFRVRAAREASSGVVFAVNTAAELVRIDAGRTQRLLDGVIGEPAPRADGSVAIARDHGELGESDIWLVSATGAARALAAAPGADDLPIALPDDRVAFVSARTGIASLWTVNVKSGELVQITNRGLRLGGGLAGFVPPPVEVLEVSAASIRYDAGGGDMRRVALP